MGGPSIPGTSNRDHQNALLRAQLVHIGSVLRTRRQAHGWPIQQLADCAGLSAAMVSLVERGLAAPSLASLSALADCLGLRMVDLFATTDDRRADGASVDGARADGVHVDGARADGAHVDGARADGARSDGAPLLDSSLTDH